MSDDLLNVTQAAAVLGVSIATVRLWCAKGQLPGARKVGRDWVIPRAAVEGVRGG